MKLFQFVLCALIYQVSYQAAVKERILNGKIVDEKSPYPFPYQVELMTYYITGDMDTCAGSLISKKYVLTAQHCLLTVGWQQPVVIIEPIAVAMAFGSKESKELKLMFSLLLNESVDKDIQVCNSCWTLHPDYDFFGNNSADIAIIELQQEVQFSDTIKPISLPSWSDRKLKLTGETAVVAGWGTTEDSPNSNTLLFAYVKIDETSRCKEYFGMPECHICSIRNFTNTKHQMTCKGDCGGPVVIGNKQVGIVSYGHPADPNEPVLPDCSTDAFDAYTSVSYFLDWISDTTGIKIYE